MPMCGIEIMLPTYLQNVRVVIWYYIDVGRFLCGIHITNCWRFVYHSWCKIPLFFGFGVLTLGTIPYIFLNTSTSTVIVSLLYALRMAGIASVMMPLTTFAMGALPDKKGADGTTANNTLRQVASSVVVALLTSVVQKVINNNH